MELLLGLVSQSVRSFDLGKYLFIIPIVPNDKDLHAGWTCLKFSSNQLFELTYTIANK